MSIASVSLRKERAKIVKDAQAILAQSTVSAEDMLAVDAALADADARLHRIEAMERADALDVTAGIDAASTAGAVRPGALGAIAFNQRRDTELATALIRGTASRGSLSRDDTDYMTATLARDKRIIRAAGLGNVSQLSDDDRAHYQGRFGQVTNAASTTSSGGGGYTVAPLFEADLLIAQAAYGGMRAAARCIMTDTGPALPWPTMDDTAQVATILGTENTTVGTGTDLVFGTVSLGGFMYISGMLPISLQLLQDSAFDFESLIRTALARRFGKGQNAHFTTGTGSGQPQGAVTGAVSGKVGLVGQTTTVIYDDFLDLEGSVDPAYRPGAVFMMHDSSRRAIRKLKDSQGHPLWQPSLTAGAPDTLLTYSMVINQDMAPMAANAKSILFGDFSNYIIRDILGLQIMVLRERFADFLQVAFQAYTRADGRLISAAQPIKYYANSAT
jgi:HK97 family phage major capsid protein